MEKEFDASFEGYWLGTTHSAIKKIKNTTDDYKLKVLKRLIPLNPEYLDQEHPKFQKLSNDLVVTIKRDGGYYTFYYDKRSKPESIFTNSPGGRAIYNLPVGKELNNNIDEINTKLIDKLKSQLKRIGKEEVFQDEEEIVSIVLAGELFANIKNKGDRPRVFDLIKHLRNPDSLEDLEKIHYDIFDIISINKVEMTNLPYELRIRLIDNLFPREDDDAPKAKVIKYKKDVKAEQLQEIFKEWVIEDHHEGLVIRNKYNLSFKVKPQFDVDAVIIGFSELLAEKRIGGEEGISSLLVAVMRDDGTYQELAHVGGGFNEEQRVDFYKLLIDDVVESSYRATKRDGRAYHFVKPKYVVQIIYTDIIEETASGRTIYHMALKYENDKWESIQSLPFISIISPRFELLRSEVDLEHYPSLEFANVKKPVNYEVNISQITSLVPIEIPKTLEAKTLPNITMIFELVFEGKWSGVLSAKKILFWATNKHDIDPMYPKYVVYFADYNYTRATPLTQDIYPFNSLEKAINHINWIFKRPDNANKGLLDNKGTRLKGSIIAKPHKFNVNDEYKPQIVKGLDPTIRHLLFEGDVLDDLLDDILDFDLNLDDL